MKEQHILERLADKLAEEIEFRSSMLANALAPAGSRPPFVQQLSRPKALAWWKENRYNDYGKQMLGMMKPEDILELDKALAEQIELEEGDGFDGILG